MIAYWDERPRDAIVFAQAGWDIVPETGESRVRLAATEARAHARLGDTAATEDALARARAERDAVVHDDDIFRTGVFAFPPAKQSEHASETHLWMGQETRHHRDAEREADMAIKSYLADAAEDRRLGELCLARLDLADARLHLGQLDGALEEVQNALAASAKRRTEPVSRRLTQLGARLDRPKLRRSPLALRLREEIRAYRAAPPAEGSV